MPKTKAQIIAEAQVVKNATEVGENTATRVGGVLEGLADADGMVIIPVTGTESGGSITLSSNPFTQVQTAENAGQHVVVRVTYGSYIVDFTMNTYSASVATYIGTANFLQLELQLICSASAATITNRSTSNTFSTGESVPSVGIDATPTQGSNNLVKSGGVYDEVNQLDQEVDKQPIAVSETGKYVDMSAGSGGSIGAAIADANYSYLRTHLSGGVLVIINATGGGSAAKSLWAFLDGNGIILEKAKSYATVASSLVIPAPQNAAEVIINTTSSGICYLSSQDSIGARIDGLIGNADAESFKLYKSKLINASSQYIGQSLSRALVQDQGASFVSLIPCAPGCKVRFPVFKSSSGLGSVFVDKDKIIVGTCLNTTEPTGNYIEYVAPANTRWLAYCVSISLTAYLPISVSCIYEYGIKPQITDLDSRVSAVAAVTDKISTNTFDVSQFISQGYYTTGVSVGAIVSKTLTKISTTFTHFVFDCKAGDTFIVNGNGGNSPRAWAFVDSNTWELLSVSAASLTATNLSVTAPSDSTLIIELRGSDSPKILAVTEDLYLRVREQYARATMDYADKDPYLALAAIRTKITTNAEPCAIGYLFTNLIKDDCSLWYGTKMDNAKKIGYVPVSPSRFSLAISPSDGRVILVNNYSNSPIYVFDGETTTRVLNTAAIKPRGWLYNSGCDFFTDGNGNECVVFAEYTLYPVEGETLRVWKGKYPYTNDSDWSVVFTMPVSLNDTANTITHFHQIKRDPWTGFLYMTSGDLSKQLRWWYSTDYGDTWTLLTDNDTNEWEAHTCRLINFIFTKHYIYWATDHWENHSLNRIQRGAGGIIDISTREKLADLDAKQATNSICLVNAPLGSFTYERIDKGETGDFLKMYFWDIVTGQMRVIVNMPKSTSSWGGNRGRCYTNYTNGFVPAPVIGFAENTLCPFNLFVEDSTAVGSIQYNMDGTISFVLKPTD